MFMSALTVNVGGSVAMLDIDDQAMEHTGPGTTDDDEHQEAHECGNLVRAPRPVLKCYLDVLNRLMHYTIQYVLVLCHRLCAIA